MKMNPQFLQFWEFLSYVVTVFGLPLAIYAVWNEGRKERVNELHEIQQRDEEMYVQLSEQYAEFLELVLKYPQLDLLNREAREKRMAEQEEQQKIILFEILIALFERAYILLYEDKMTGESQRRWQSWVDYIKWWCQRVDFRDHLNEVLEGEDPGFANYIRSVAGLYSTK